MGLDASASIAIISLVFTTGGVFLATFIQVPILDYHVINELGSEERLIELNNLGNKPAVNILVTFEEKDIIFKTFTIHPFLSKYLNFNGSNDIGSGLGFVKIDKLPSFSTTTIKAQTERNSNVSEDPKLEVSIRSDEVVGTTNTKYILIFYSSLIAIYLILPLLFWRGILARTRRNAFWSVLFVTQGVSLGIVLVWPYFRY